METVGGERVKKGLNSEDNRHFHFRALRVITLINFKSK